MRTYTLRQTMALAFSKGTNHALRMQAMQVLSLGIRQEYTLNILKEVR